MYGCGVYGWGVDDFLTLLTSGSFVCCDGKGVIEVDMKVVCGRGECGRGECCGSILIRTMREAG